MNASSRHEAARGRAIAGDAARRGGKRQASRPEVVTPGTVRLRRARRDWGATLLRPHVLVAFLAFVAALPYLFGAFGPRPAEAALPPLGAPSQERVQEWEMPVVLVGLDGAVRTVLVGLRSADHESARLAETAAAVRDALVDDGIWPSEIGAPTVGVFTSNRQRIVVVDVPSANASAVSVAQEWAALRSLTQTMHAAGADEVRIIVAGAPAATLWGNVALP